MKEDASVLHAESNQRELKCWWERAGRRRRRKRCFGRQRSWASDTQEKFAEKWVNQQTAIQCSDQCRRLVLSQIWKSKTNKGTKGAERDTSESVTGDKVLCVTDIVQFCQVCAKLQHKYACLTVRLTMLQDARFKPYVGNFHVCPVPWAIGGLASDGRKNWTSLCCWRLGEQEKKGKAENRFTGVESLVFGSCSVACEAGVRWLFSSQGQEEGLWMTAEVVSMKKWRAGWLDGLLGPTADQWLVIGDHEFTAVPILLVEWFFFFLSNAHSTHSSRSGPARWLLPHSLSLDQ